MKIATNNWSERSPIVDASEPLSEQDQRVIAAVVDAGRALVIAFNKWDLLDEDCHEQLEREISDRGCLRAIVGAGSAGDCGRRGRRPGACDRLQQVGSAR